MSHDDHCDGNHKVKCKAMERIKTALGFYHNLAFSAKFMKSGWNPKEQFASFCEKCYPKRDLLNDYIHWVLHHNDEEEIIKIRKQLQFDCDLANQCGATTRHYRDRRADGNETAGDAPNWFTDKMDCIHFNVYHLHELGMRVPAEELLNGMEVDAEKYDENQMKELALKRLTEIIESKRKVLSNGRLDGVDNTKYSLHVTKQQINAKDTKRESLMKGIWKQMKDEDQKLEFQHLILKHDIDSDCIKEDVELFIEEKMSNLYLMMSARFELEGVYNLTVSTTCSNCTLLDEAQVSSLSQFLLLLPRQTPHVYQNLIYHEAIAHRTTIKKHEIKLDHISHPCTTTNHSAQSFHLYTFQIHDCVCDAFPVCLEHVAMNLVFEVNH